MEDSGAVSTRSSKNRPKLATSTAEAVKEPKLILTYQTWVKTKDFWPKNFLRKIDVMENLNFL